MLRVSPDQGSDVYLLRKMVEEVFDVLYSKNLHASIWGFGLPPGLADLPSTAAGCGFWPQPGSLVREQVPGRGGEAGRAPARVSVALRWDPATASSLSSVPNWVQKNPHAGGSILCPSPPSRGASAMP